MTPRHFKRGIYYLTCACLLINFGVKLGLIYGYELKEILVLGATIDMIGVWLIAKFGRL